MDKSNSKGLFVTRVYLIPCFMLFLAAPSLALAQGYSGLFGPGPEEKPAASAPVATPVGPQVEAPSVSHIIAPAPAPKTRATKTTATPPVTTGYSGLISGTAPATPKASRAATAVKEKTPQMSTAVIPMASSRMNMEGATARTIKTSAELKRAAFFEGLRENGISNKKHPLPAGWGPIIAQTSTRDANGKSTVERMTDDRIKRAMAEVNDPALSPEERKKKARAAYEKLLNDGDGIIALTKASNTTFTTYGAPKEMIDERAENNSRALSAIQNTLKQLKDMQ